MTPNDASTDTFEGSLLLHVPPVTPSESVIDDPVQTDEGPEMEVTAAVLVMVISNTVNAVLHALAV